MSETPSVGASVVYVPHECHWNDRVLAGPVFELVDAKTGEPGKDLDKGVSRDASGQLCNHRGHTLKVGKPLMHFPAKIDALHADGSADLTVSHPWPRLIECFGVKHSATKEPHTWHMEGE